MTSASDKWSQKCLAGVVKGGPGGCFTNVSRAPQNILAKIHYTRNHIYGENFNLKICTCAQSKAWAHVQSFSLKFSSQVLFVQYTNFEIIFWRARETLVKQPPGTSVSEEIFSYLWYDMTSYMNIFNDIRCAAEIRLHGCYQDSVMMLV